MITNSYGQQNCSLDVLWTPYTIDEDCDQIYLEYEEHAALPIVYYDIVFHFKAHQSSSLYFTCDPNDPILDNNSPFLLASNFTDHIIEEMNSRMETAIVGASNPDTRIRFRKLDATSDCSSIYFYEHNESFNSFSNAINIKFYLDPDPTFAYSNFGVNWINYQASITDFEDEDNGSWWEVGRHLLHEFGHTRHLFHGYNCDNPCNILEESSSPLADINADDECWGQCVNGNAGEECWNSSPDELIMSTGSQVHYTPCEVAHMWTFILNHPSPYQELDFCEDTDSPDLVYDVNGVIEWKNKKIFNKDIIIKNGTTIKVHCDVLMGHEKKIIVEAGGRLFVEETGRIVDLCDIPWDGIYAYGDLSEGQTNYTAQAIVKVKPGGIVENSLNGVNLIDGAVGWFVHGVFKNNKKAVVFHDYNASNFSYIKSCLFLIDQDYMDFDHINEVRQVNMSNVRGIDIRNNEFLNSEENGGVGIMSIDAGYSVYASAATNTSSFTGWKYGINAKGTCAINTFRVKHTEFERCEIGLLVETVDYFEVIENEFRLSYGTGPGFSNAEIGIMTDYCTGYDIAFNNFTGNNAGNTISQNQPIGVVIKDSGNEGNKIEVNTYTGCYIANLSNGDNKEEDVHEESGGLKYLCNEQVDNINDIVIPDESGIFGVSMFQGDNTHPAGNTFSAVSSWDHNISNHDFTGPNDHMKYYFKHVQGPNDQYPENVYGVDRIALDFGRVCRDAVTTGGGGPTDGPTPDKEVYVLQELQSEEDEYNQLIQSIEWSSASEAQKANLSSVKSNYYQLINFGLFSESMKEDRNLNNYATFLSKKSNEETRFLSIALDLSRNLPNQALITVNNLTGEDYDFHLLHHTLCTNEKVWTELNADEIDDLESYSTLEDNRTSLASINVLEYYYGFDYPKDIVLPSEIIQREDGKKRKIEETTISSFPNPSSGLTTITMSNVVNGQMQIVDITGKILQVIELKHVEAQDLDLRSFSGGIYFVKVEDSIGHVSMHKIIKL